MNTRFVIFVTGIASLCVRRLAEWLPRRRDVSWSALLQAAGWALQNWTGSGDSR